MVLRLFSPLGQPWQQGQEGRLKQWAVGDSGSQRQETGGEGAGGKDKDQLSSSEEGGGMSAEKHGLRCSLLSVRHIL